MRILTPKFFSDLKLALGKLWDLAEAFKLNGDALVIVSQHPALYWEARLRKREMVEYLKAYGIRDIRIRGSAR